MPLVIGITWPGSRPNRGPLVLGLGAQRRVAIGIGFVSEVRTALVDVAIQAVCRGDP